MELLLTNSLSRKKESFKTLHPKKVTLYVCGITPYDFAHIGHGRCYVNFDVLVRFLKLLEYDVTYVRNYTDIDDKILKKTQDTTGDQTNYKVIADEFIDTYKDDMHKLGCLDPDVEPRVTEHINEIIRFIEKLVEKGNAYVIDHDVYFDITTFASYGKLSGKKIEDLKAGSRVEKDERKKNPGDFALWKGNTEKLFWQSPWGYGRPAWHIECSALSKKYLGETIDIHAGGMDLQFPHHENEIAQSESLHDKPFAHYWLHNAFVNINKEKMSKSLGNIVSLSKIFETVDPMVLRYFFLQHHYRTPIDFSFEEIEAVKTAYKKLINIFTHITIEKDKAPKFSTVIADHTLIKKMINALYDDLNTPKVLGLVFQNLSTITASEELSLATVLLLRNVLGLSLQPLKEKKVEITPEIQAMIDEREQARKAKDWTRADQIRDKLIEMDVEIQDKKSR